MGIEENTNANFISDKNGSWSYPTSAQLNFGTDFAGSEYIIPVVRFEFFNSVGDGTASPSPIIYIKMGGSFQSGLSNSWGAATNIYGTPGGSVNDDSLERAVESRAIGEGSFASNKWAGACANQVRSSRKCCSLFCNNDRS